MSITKRFFNIKDNGQSLALPHIAHYWKKVPIFSCPYQHASNRWSLLPHKPSEIGPQLLLTKYLFRKPLVFVATQTFRKKVPIFCCPYHHISNHWSTQYFTIFYRYSQQVARNLLHNCLRVGGWVKD